MDLLEVLQSLSDYLVGAEDEEWFGWLPPLCPYCNLPLSAKFASTRLLCFKCNREFELIEVDLK